MSDTSNETGPISMNDAISLLSNPTEDTATDERAEVQAEPQQPEAEATEPLMDNVEDDAPEDDYDDEADDGEDVDYDDDDSEDEQAPEENVYTVKVDGEEIEVSLDEALKGYQRQKAFTKRSMELAEQRKAFEAEAAQTKQLRDAYAQQLEVLRDQISSAIPEQEPDWSALKDEGYSTDDIFFAKTEWDKSQRQLAAANAERERIAQEQAYEYQEQMKRRLADQRVEMLNRIPEWQNDDVREKERNEVIKYAQRRIGFSEEEIQSASDSRAIELLYKAWKYDTLMEKKPSAKQRTRKSPKMARAGQPTTKRDVANRSRREAKKRFEAEGTVDAAVNYLMGR